MAVTWVEIGPCRLACADCREVLPTLEAGSVDAVVTDPPYGVGFKYSSHDDSRDGYEEWCGQWFGELQRITPTAILSCGQVNLAMWARIHPFKWVVAWLKPAAMGRSPLGFCNWEPMPLWGRGVGGSVDVFTAGIVPADDLGGHPCPKPLRWGREAVARVSTRGQIVLDPFLGSGTTGVACVQTGRRFVGIEIDPGYFDTACRRIEAAVKDQRDSLFPAAASPAVPTPDLFGDAP